MSLLRTLQRRSARDDARRSAIDQAQREARMKRAAAIVPFAHFRADSWVLDGGGRVCFPNLSGDGALVPMPGTASVRVPSSPLRF